MMSFEDCVEHPKLVVGQILDQQRSAGWETSTKTLVGWLWQDAGPVWAFYHNHPTREGAHAAAGSLGPHQIR